MYGSRGGKSRGSGAGRVGGRVDDLLHYEAISSLIALGMGNSGMQMQKVPSSAEST